MLPRLALALMTAVAPIGAAADFRLAWPVDCVPGETCHVQNYVDHDPGPGWRDFACHGLSYDGHKGTDIALATRAEIAQGIAVLAAAPGVVRGTRDGMADQLYTGQDLGGRECGNGAVIDHGNGWETQYCHLRNGSLNVSSGDVIKQGHKLGEIGLSGATQFAHLHLSLRKDGTVVDPFAPGGAPACDVQSHASLWEMPVAYDPGGLLDVGFATEVPDFDAIKAGKVGAKIAQGTPLVLYGYGYGMRAGDVMRLTITGPEGPVYTRDERFERARAQAFRAGGRRAPAAGWIAGTYVGEVWMLRDGDLLSQRNVLVTVP